MLEGSSGDLGTGEELEAALGRERMGFCNRLILLARASHERWVLLRRLKRVALRRLSAEEKLPVEPEMLARTSDSMGS